jgi:hypothetical protein
MSLFFFHRVCKKWNALVKDSTLWSQIDLSRYRFEMTLADVKNLISVYGCRDSTRSLSLCGNFSHDSVISGNSDQQRDENTLIYYLDTEFLDTLVEKCPNLSTIQLEHLDLSKLELRMFFAFTNLESFSLKWCFSDASWFRPPHGLTTRIKRLHFVRSSSDKLAKADMENICKHMPELTTLSIIQTKSTLTDEIVELIAKNCSRLETLELVNTQLTDQAVLSLCESPSLCARLRHLNLSMSSSLSNNCLACIGERMRGLRSLNLTSCFGISSISLLQNLSGLSYLNINNTSLDKIEIRDRLVPLLPKCEIEFGHEKMLNRKLMWTINGSRNCVCSF